MKRRAQIDRKDRIDEQERSVERDVRALDESTGLLGNQIADELFTRMLPDVAARLIANRKDQLPAVVV